MRSRALALVSIALLGSFVRADEIDDLVRANMAEHNIKGIAVGIVVDGVLQERRTYGLANIETRTPVRPETVFKIASMSKAFCATAAMMLIDEGKMSLEDRVVDILPTAPASWNDIKIKHLLSHTSGIPDAPGFQFTARYTIDSFLALYEGTELDTKPGDTYRYNNFGYATLGQVIHKVSGKPLREFVTERILEPLGMSATHYYDLGRIVPQRANGYTLRIGSKPVNPNPTRPTVYDGSGGLLTNLLDYAQWDKALRSDFLISDEIKQQMWTRFTLNNGQKGSYGFGWFPGSVGGEKTVAHSGGTAGFTSYVLRGLESGVTVFVFRNGATGRPQALAESILSIVKNRKVARVARQPVAPI